jgi:hypothetical protein
MSRVTGVVSLRRGRLAVAVLAIVVVVVLLAAVDVVWPH